MAQSQRIAPIVKSWKRRLADPYHHVRSYAESLYMALAAVSTCTCACPYYQISLQVPNINCVGSELLGFCFHLVLAVDTSASSSPSTHIWTWQEIEVLIKRYVYQLETHGKNKAKAITTKVRVNLILAN
jgi:hypothetical protein